MERIKILQIVYTFFVGVLIATFVGVGINTFYAPPKAPEFPMELNNYGKVLSPEQAERQREFDSRNLEYQNKMKPYNRNVSIMTMVLPLHCLQSVFSLRKESKLLLAE